ncbi:MAG TPA: hypothetical protein VNZ26_28620 [Vicinamibacterales bacterium]|jgi:hypothetical protein|nr:hypothetical protein [Vicinamibacterales bacterium]
MSSDRLDLNSEGAGVEMADKSIETELSRKEYAQRMRRAAYLRAKELRAKDPRQLALKEALRQRRRAAYQQAKERRKMKREEDKARLGELRAEKRASTDLELMKLVKPGSHRE